MPPQPPSPPPAAVAPTIARITTIINGNLSKDSFPADDLEFLTKNARFLQDPSVTGNFVSLAQVMWDFIDDFAKQSVTPRRAATAAAASSILAHLYAPERKLNPTKADLESAVSFAVKGAKLVPPTTLPLLQRDAVLLGCLQLLGSVASADPSAVLRHVKDEWWPLCGGIRSSIVYVMVGTMLTALRELLLLESVSNRAELSAEYLVSFAKEAKFQAGVFQALTTAGLSTPRPAPATLNALAQLSATFRVMTQNVVNNAPPAVKPGLVRRLRAALAQARTEGHFTALHLPLVTAVGDWEFLVQLLVARLASPLPSSASVTLNIVNPMDSVAKEFLTSVEGTVTLLVAIEVASKAPTSIVSTSDESHSVKLAQYFIEEVLLCTADALPQYHSKRFVPASALLLHLSHVVAHIVVPHEAANAWIRERFAKVASRFYETAKQFLARGKQELYDVAQHGYLVLKTMLPVISKMCIRYDTPPTHSGGDAAAKTPATATDYRVTFASSAHELFESISLLQPLGLLHRSRAPKTDASKRVAAADWSQARSCGSQLMEFIVTDQNQLRTLLVNLRRVTERPDLGTDVFLSERVFFMAYVLSASQAAASMSVEQMLSLWVPSGVKCCLSESPALRSAGHFLLAGVMLQQHPVSVPVFSVYMNLFVATPRPARDPERGYGPVPPDSVKLFSRMFARVVLAIEPLEASTASKDVDGQGVAIWGINRLAGVCAYYLALVNPNPDERERRKQYFCSLIDTLQTVNPEVLGASRAAIERLLLSLRHPAEAAVFLDYASAIVEGCRQSVTKRSTVEWLLDVKALLDARGPTRSKL